MRSCVPLVGTLLFGMVAGCAAGERTAPPHAFARVAEPLPRAEPTPGSAGVAPSKVSHATAGRPVVAPAPDASAGWEAGTTPDPRDRERDLRHELALATDPTAAAIELAAWLARDERHAEALQVVDTARTRSNHHDLRILRADLLRDLGQRHAAVAELRALRTELGVDRMPPELLFDLAELEALEGNHPAAAATLQVLGTVHARDPWVVDATAKRQALAAEIAGGRPTTVKVRDVLGNLRGAPFADDRLQALERLVRVRLGDDQDDSIHQLAVVIALGDPAEAVRAHAVAHADPVPDQRLEFLAAALADSSSLVRRRALSRAVDWRQDGTVPLLLAWLDRETDAATFVQVCDALRAFTPELPATSLPAASSSSGRAAVAIDYRRRLAP
ncbi:MAG: hypothetical protein JNK15_15315 [Planctomycetes bacterium]|nr:hypothetical protein [Planctomycetota bacterium]